MTKKSGKEKSNQKAKSRKIKLHKETVKDLDPDKSSTIKGGRPKTAPGTEQYTCPLTCK